jgi:hypothetical protein
MSGPSFDFGGEIVWQPTPEIIAQSRLKQFMDRFGVASFDELLRHSTTDLEWFWNAVLKFLDIQFYKPYSQVIDLSNGVEWPQWCVGGEMNIVHNCLDKRIGTPAEHKVALIYESEDGLTRTFTYGQLCREVNQAANALRAIGLGKGDAIGLFMPMAGDRRRLPRHRQDRRHHPPSVLRLWRRGHLFALDRCCGQSAFYSRWLLSARAGGAAEDRRRRSRAAGANFAAHTGA